MPGYGWRELEIKPRAEDSGRLWSMASMSKEDRWA